MSKSKSYVVHIVPPRARRSNCGMADPNGRLISAESAAGALRMVETAPTLSSYAGTSWSVCGMCTADTVPG